MNAAEQEPQEDNPIAVDENTIHQVIVHTISKVEGKLTLDPRETVLEIGSTVQRLIGQLSAIYIQRTGKSHGKFEDDEDNYPVKKYLSDYCSADEPDFVKTTKDMSKTLFKEISGTASPGGHVFFAHFNRNTENDQDEYFIVAILNDELGAALNKEKDVVDAMHLNIKGFRLAGRINITKWKNNSEKYLSFIKGRGQDKVSDFFKSFLGCNNSVLAAAETQNLTKILEYFSKAKQMSEEQKDLLLKKAFHICKGYIEKDRPFELQSFANELWPGDPKDFTDAVAESNIEISDGFVPDKRSLNRLVKFSGKTKHWSLDFDRDALAGKEITFDKKTGTLTINNLPAELLERMHKEHQDC